MIVPQRAAVRPRVLSAESGEVLLLEDEIRQWMERASRRGGVIVLLGSAGAGKTTALRHLAAALPEGGMRLEFLDEPIFDRIADRPGRTLLICTLSPQASMIDPATGRLLGWGEVHLGKLEQKVIAPLATYQLAGWDRDDLLEYLLAVHPAECAGVMSRLSASGGDSFLSDRAELWRPVLDRLAADPSLPNSRSAFHRYLQELLADTDLIERARSVCLNAILTAEESIKLGALARPGFAVELRRILRHDAVKRMLAAERIAADVHAECDCDFLAHQLPRDLVGAVGELIRKDRVALDHLRKLLAGPNWSHAMSASLLHAAGTGWFPATQPPPLLAGAYLDGAVWWNVQLAGANLETTDLSGADLRDANLTEAVAFAASFCQTAFVGVTLQGLRAMEADLSGAILKDAKAEGAVFNVANLSGARLKRVDLGGSSFTKADLRRASFRQTNLKKASFQGARIKKAIFSEVDLQEAVLSRLCLRDAIWRDCRNFSRAQLDHCDMEKLSFPDTDFTAANLEGALLTATVMPRAIFRCACLRDTGLADIDWEGADLRGADLTGATFHMGSTRSGLVGSPIACEGSRTGFYTDDYEEQLFKAPEEIRKANLCGADLRGACITGVDFYLVDLRGALLLPEDEDHVRRCRAILETPVA